VCVCVYVALWELNNFVKYSSQNETEMKVCVFNDY